VGGESLTRCGLVAVSLALACMPRPAERLLSQTPNPWVGDQGKCSVRHSQSNPLIVEWPAADRGSLEMRLRKGTAVVRYEGCRMEVLRRCSVPGSSYAYGGFTRKTEQVRMRDADELYANLPVGAARFEAKLQSAEALTVAMTMVGMYESDRDAVGLDEVTGECEGATHIVSGVQVGAYEFFAERSAQVGGSAGLASGPAIGGASGAERETLTRDGELQRCEGATADDTVPPEGCGALLRLEVVPLGESRQATARCPEGMAWSGTQCRSVRGDEDTTVVRGSVSGGVRDAGANERCPNSMAYIPGGGLEGESIEDYCLDITEVTVRSYRSCVDAGQCEPASRTVWWPKIEDRERDAASELCTWGVDDRADHPVNCVTWAQARSFCQWRGARLPRDIEWTWAAIGGADGRTYPWGDAPVTAARVNACGTECRAWFERREVQRPRVTYDADDGWAGTAIVGSYPAGRSRWGPVDMAGNVAEWTADTARSLGRRRVRGGSFWVQRPAWLSRTDTAAEPPQRRDAVIGFRCADDI
jgi:hypothetical protein